ncbi:hypothetical protein Tco_0926464 [Tanacetum coccineum]|uniref:Uncharacterized protein n=1 Tax=Tanacetum coccineum TaxID=301880 RepID=A0ABQ5D9W0_9ASTR
MLAVMFGKEILSIVGSKYNISLNVTGCTVMDSTILISCPPELIRTMLLWDEEDSILGLLNELRRTRNRNRRIHRFASSYVEENIDSDPTMERVSLPNITTSILGLVVDYVKMKKNFVKSTVIEAGFYDHTVSTLYELSKEAAYLDMPMLYNYAPKPLFEKLTPVPVGEVRRLFPIDVETMSPRTKSSFQIYVPQLFEDEKPICCCIIT